MKQTLEEIKAEIRREGIENVIFMHKLKDQRAPFVAFKDKEYVPCYIWIPDTENELHNELYNFYGEYKMYLKALNERYGKDDFYVSDFLSLVEAGIIKWIRAKH